MTASASLQLAQSLLNTIVTVTVDRQLGSSHPKWGFTYDCNYGFIKGVLAPDGEELDAYVLKVDTPVDTFTGRVVAIVHRLKDDDDKLVVVPDGQSISDEEIETTTAFQEKWFDHQIIK